MCLRHVVCSMVWRLSVPRSVSEAAALVRPLRLATCHKLFCTESRSGLPRVPDFSGSCPELVLAVSGTVLPS